MRIKRNARPTLTAIEMMHGERLEFTLGDNRVVSIDLIETHAEIVRPTPERPAVPTRGARMVYRFWAYLRIDGEEVRLEREVGTQASFYEPWEGHGIRLWLDAVDAIFEFVRETHGPCRLQENCSCRKPMPVRRHARIALQDVSMRICPEIVHPWCPLPWGGLKIENCFRGEACWLGAFRGGSAHGGLDINHPSGTPLYAPIALDDHFLCGSLEMGHANNSWRGVRQWRDHTMWILGSSHMNHLTVPEHTALAAGRPYADGAGVRVGAFEHSHFTWAVVDHGELIRLDPWILFWQAYHDMSRRASKPV